MDATVSSLLSIDAGSVACQACVRQTCTAQITACSADCVCNDAALGALACIEGLGAGAAPSAAAACVAGLSSSNDHALVQAGACLGSCANACTGGTGDGGSDGAATDASAGDAGGGDASGGDASDASVDSSPPGDGSAESSVPDAVSDAPPDGALALDAALEQPDGGQPFYVVPSGTLGLLALEGALGDFNHDGKLDVAIAGEDVSNVFGVIIALGDGKGGFVYETTVGGVGSPPCGVAVGNFDHDGNPDLAVQSSTGGPYVALGKGDGTFHAATSHSLGASGLTSGVEVGDMNGDGFDDMAVYTQPLNVLFNDKAGGFLGPVGVATGVFTARFAVGDVDGDGIADIAFTDNRIFVALASGDAGTFTGATTILGSGRSVALGDLDHNGRVDLVSGDDQGSNANVWVTLQNTNGTWQPQVTYGSSAGGPRTPVVADFNHDGKLDVAVGRAAAVDLYPGVGDGTLAAPGNYALTLAPTFVLTGDVNNDGFPDIVVVANSGGVFATTLLNAQ